MSYGTFRSPCVSCLLAAGLQSTCIQLNWVLTTLAAALGSGTLVLFHDACRVPFNPDFALRDIDAQRTPPSVLLSRTDGASAILATPVSDASFLSTIDAVHSVQRENDEQRTSQLALHTPSHGPPLTVAQAARLDTRCAVMHAPPSTDLQRPAAGSCTTGGKA